MAFPCHAKGMFMCIPVPFGAVPGKGDKPRQRCVRRPEAARMARSVIHVGPINYFRIAD
jgi:hypothetical protein